MQFQEPVLEEMFIDSKSTTSTWSLDSLGKAFSCNTRAKRDNAANIVLSSDHTADPRLRIPNGFFSEPVEKSYSVATAI